MDKDILYLPNWDASQTEEACKLQGPILIIGASGFIGANLFHSLRNVRDDVYALSRNPQKSWRLSGVEPAHLINSDIIEFDQLQRVFTNLNPQTVFNLSAYGAYARQIDAERIHLTNYMGTVNILKLLMDTGCSAFVQAGTSSEYGLNCEFPDEKSELVPNSDYAVSKVGAAYLIKYYGIVHNLPCVNLRLYSIYGPWEERDRLIPTLISFGLQGKYPKLVNPSISRDFVYVDDCTNALVKAALTACKTNSGASINIASGKKTTLSDVANISKELFKIQQEPMFGNMPNRKWDLADWYGNPQLAIELLGWKSRLAIEDGLKLTTVWEKEAADRLKYVSVPVKDKKITAIIACYKDNQSIPILYERLSTMFVQSGYDYEIIFVNDASPFNDEEVVAKICATDSHVIGISHSRNFGSQSAFISGMELSSGDAVILMDGDGQDPPEIIPNFIDKWEEGYEIVYGNRIKREAPLYMQFLYKLFYRIFKKLSDVTIPVDAGDFSLINRKAADHMLTFSEKDIFIRGLRAWIGFRQIGVPYIRPERLFGQSTNSFFKNIWWAKKGIFSFSIKPLQYIQTIGFIVFLLTIGLSAFYVIEYFLNPPENAQGIPTLILIMLGLGGIQLISISILGDYIGKIIEEVKNRPKFIRDKIIYNGKTYKRQQEINKVIHDIKQQGTI